jgi:hypothetical protein
VFRVHTKSIIAGVKNKFCRLKIRSVIEVHIGESRGFDVFTSPPESPIAIAFYSCFPIPATSLFIYFDFAEKPFDILIQGNPPDWFILAR